MRTQERGKAILKLYESKWVWLFFGLAFLLSFALDLALWFVKRYEVPSYVLALVWLCLAAVCFAESYGRPTTGAQAA